MLGKSIPVTGKFNSLTKEKREKNTTVLALTSTSASLFATTYHVLWAFQIFEILVEGKTRYVHVLLLQLILLINA
jgi:hypothetical protein